MNGKLMPTSCMKPVCSVSELAKAVGLSRGRFYQLVERGVFPYPIYDLQTRRPYYPMELQQICHEVRRTNIGHDGRPILFYAPRQKTVQTAVNSTSSAKKGKSSSLSPRCQELAGALVGLGLGDVSPEQVQEAVTTLFPDQSVDALDQGIVLRTLFRHFKARGS